jgi:hypothetical protein
VQQQQYSICVYQNTTTNTERDGRVRERKRESEEKNSSFVPEQRRLNVEQSVHDCLSLCLDVFRSYIVFFLFRKEK